MHCSVQETADRKSHPNLPAESSAVLISGFVQKRCCVRRFHELGNAHNACRHDATSTTRTRNLHTHIIVGRNAPSNANNTECKYMRRAHTRHPTGHTSYLTTTSPHVHASYSHIIYIVSAEVRQGFRIWPRKRGDLRQIFVISRRTHTHTLGI